MKKQFSKIDLLFYTCNLWLVFIFLFSPHYISSGNVLEAWAISKDFILYKQMASFHLPLGRIPPLIIYSFSNWDLTATPFLGLFIGIANLYLIYKIAKKYFSNIGTFFSLLFFTLLFWFYSTGVSFYHEQLIALFLTVSLYFLFDLISSKKIETRNVILIGFFAALAELSGQVASLTVIPLYFISGYYILRKSRKALSDLAALLFSGAVTLVPLIAYFWIHNALPEFFYWNVTYYLDYAKITTNPTDLPLFDIFIFYLPGILILFSLITSMGKWVNQKSKKFTAWDPNLVIMLFLAVASIPFTVFSVFHFHHFTYSLPVLTLCLGFALSNRSIRFVKIFTISILIALSCYSIIRVFDWTFSHLTMPPDFSIRNDVKTTDSDWQVVNWLKQKTNPTDRILVIGNAMIYVRSDRLPSTRPAHSIPFSWIPFAKIKQEVLTQSADYLLTDSAFTIRLKRDYKLPDMYNFVSDLESNCYKKVYSIDTWEIWKHTCR